MKFSRFYFAPLAFALIAMGACSDKEGDNDDNDDNQEQIGGTGSIPVKTPEESKEYISTTADEAIKAFKPENQEPAIELASYFEENYAELELPEEFYFDDDDDAMAPGYTEWRSPLNFIKAIGKVAKGDYMQITRAAETFDVDFDMFTGIFEPQGDQWKKTGDSKSVIFRFKGVNGQNCELRADKSGGDWKESFTFEEEDGYWNGYQYIYTTDEYIYNVSVPRVIDIKLTQGANVIAQTNLQSNLDVKGHKISASVDGTVCDIKVQASIDGTDSRISHKGTVTVDGRQIATTYAVLNGSNLCNTDKYAALEDLEDDELENELAKMFSNAEMQADVLGKIQVYGSGKYYKGLGEDTDCWYSPYDDLSQAEAKSECEKVCNRLNQNIKVSLRYDGTATEQANLIFKPALDEYGKDTSWYGWEIYPSYYLQFPDGTTYVIEEYAKRFASVETSFNSLIDSYDRLWRSYRK